MFKSITKYTKEFTDSRGQLLVLYESEDIVIKRSFSKKGVFRGMHFQNPPMKQTKLIRVVSGEIIDIIFNPKIKPYTFFTKTIKGPSDWIEIGDEYAHGFYAIKNTEFEYICIGAYSEFHESAFNITQILKDELKLSNLRLSEKDLKAPRITPLDSVVIHVE